MSKLKPGGKVRICADFTHTIFSVINTQLYPLLHPEEMFADLAGRIFFTKLVSRVEKSLRSSSLSIRRWASSGIMYSPIRLASAPAIVQAAQKKLFQGIKVVKVYIDDVLFFPRSKEEHIRTLEGSISSDSRCWAKAQGKEM
uniref:Putative LOC100494601 [Xenopus (Silurana) tropicalis] n=1 Tax=Lepeophtheirus salmonis TaxID=72036 RepID=A0A0K2TJ57_LEPSM